MDIGKVLKFVDIETKAKGAFDFKESLYMEYRRYILAERKVLVCEKKEIIYRFKSDGTKEKVRLQPKSF